MNKWMNLGEWATSVGKWIMVGQEACLFNTHLLGTYYVSGRVVIVEQARKR